MQSRCELIEMYNVDHTTRSILICLNYLFLFHHLTQFAERIVSSSANPSRQLIFQNTNLNHKQLVEDFPLVNKDIVHSYRLHMRMQPAHKSNRCNNKFTTHGLAHTASACTSVQESGQRHDCQTTDGLEREIGHHSVQV